MKFPLTELAQEDLRLYFANTYVKMNLTDKERKEFKIPPDEHWFYVSEAGWEGEPPIGSDKPGQFINVYFRRLRTKIEDFKIRVRDDLFESVFPTPGFYNFKGTAVRYFRTTRRQNKKGICNENTKFINFMTVMEKIKDFPKEFLIANQFKLNSANLNILFGSTAPVSLEYVFRRINEGAVVARALTPDLCVSVGVKDKYPSLWIGKSYAGRLVGPGKVAIDVPPLEQEVSDQLRKFAVQITG